MGLFGFLFGGGSSVTEKRRSAYEETLSQLKREKSDIEDEIDHIKLYIRDQENALQNYKEKAQEYKREYERLHWAWQSERDHSQKERKRVAAGNMLGNAAHYEEKGKYHEREIEKAERRLHEYERMLSNKVREIKETEREFENAMDELSYEIKEVKSKIRKIEYDIRELENEAREEKYFRDLSKEEAKEIKTELRNARYKEKSGSKIDELEMALYEAERDYKKYSDLYEQSRRDIWEFQQELQNLKDELSDLEDAYGGSSGGFFSFF